MLPDLTPSPVSERELPFLPMAATLRLMAAMACALWLLSFSGCMPVIVCVLRETRGQVLDADANSPIPGATVTVRYFTGGIDGTASATTDAEGKFAIAARYAVVIMVAPNDINITDFWHATASAPGYANSSFGEGRVIKTAPVPNVLFRRDVGTIFLLQRRPPPTAPPSP